MSTPLSNTLTHLHQMVVKHLDLPEDRLDDQASFTDLGLDSLTLVDFMFAVEDHYHIDIDHERALRTPTLTGLADLVDELCAAKAPLAAAA